MFLYPYMFGVWEDDFPFPQVGYVIVPWRVSQITIPSVSFKRNPGGWVCSCWTRDSGRSFLVNGLEAIDFPNSEMATGLWLIWYGWWLDISLRYCFHKRKPSWLMVGYSYVIVSIKENLLFQDSVGVVLKGAIRRAMIIDYWWLILIHQIVLQQFLVSSIKLLASSELTFFRIILLPNPWMKIWSTC